MLGPKSNSVYPNPRARMNSWLMRADVEEREAVFNERVAENQRRVFQIAYGVLGNKPDAEDVAQEAFLKAYEKSSSLREAEKFRAWVNRIAFRLALNRQRGLRRRLSRETAWQTYDSANSLDPSKDAEQQVMAERLRKQVAALPEKLRVVLQLSIVEGMEPTDVGDVLGIPAGTVRSRLHAARKQLLEVMK
jgi:RNA polymerase sigma-70 factor (ECF subfamily)